MMQIRMPMEVADPTIAVTAATVVSCVESGKRKKTALSEQDIKSLLTH